MTRKRKILIILCLCFVLGLLALAGVGLYYFSHPSELKSLAEGTLSRFTGTECTIKEISYSRSPLVIRAKDIQMIEHIQGFYLDIPEVLANLSLEGSFGRRTLIFRDLRIRALTLSMNQGWRPPEIIKDAERPSLLRRVMGGLLSFFLFKDIEVREAEMEDGHITGQWGDLIVNLNGLNARLSPEQIFSIGCGARIQSHSGHVDLKIPRLTLATARPVYPLGSKIEAIVKGEEISLETSLGRMAEASLESWIIYSPQDESVEVESMKVSFEGIRVNEGRGTRFVPLRSLVEGGGRLDFHKASLTFPSLRAVLGNIAEFKGEFHTALQEGEGFTVMIGELKAAPQNLIPLLPGRVKRKLDPFTLAGSILVNGRLDGALGQDFQSWTCDLRARLRENKVTYADPANYFETRMTGEIHARGTLSGPDILFKGDWDDCELQARNIRLGGGTIRVSLGGTYPAVDLKTLHIRVPSARWEVEERALLLEDIEGQASSGRLDVVERTLRLPELMIQSSVLKNLAISTVITENELSFDAKGTDVHLVEFLQAMGLFPSDWKTRSTDSLSAEVVRGANGDLTLTSRVKVGGLSFESPDGRWVGENLSLVLEPTIERSPANHEVLKGSVFLYAREGELLFDRFYFDLGRHNLTSNARVNYAPDPSFVELSDFRFQLEDLATLTAQGTLSSGKSEGSKLSVGLSKTPLSPLFRQLVVEPYKHRNAFLADLQLNGILSVELEMSEEDALRTVKGHAFLHEGEALLKEEGIALKGIDMDLPLWHQAAIKGTEEKRKARKSPLEIEGGLSIRSTQLPFLPEQPVDLFLKAAPDRLSTTSPLSFMVPGGQIDVGRLVLRNIFSGAPELETSLTVKGLDLAPWLSRIWPQPVQGTARGELDSVRFEGATLRTRGQIEASVFGGRIVISNVGLKRTVSLAPVIQLDAEWEDILLSEMTQGTAFGKVEGILKGHVKGLEISDGQPQKFDLLMETVKKTKVPQKISVQAVDNIARIGGGASPFGGVAGAFVSFFKELPYEKIGVKASLENDVFRINGTVKEDGREYLVKKGGFSGVDVIIGGVGSNTISFKDMVNRIGRVRSSQEGPVVE